MLPDEVYWIDRYGFDMYEPYDEKLEENAPYRSVDGQYEYSTKDSFLELGGYVEYIDL